MPEPWHPSRSPMRPLKRLPIVGDNIVEPIAAVIMATGTGTRIMAMPTQPTRITAMPTGRTVITATAGDQVLASVSDVAGVGATNQQLYEAQLAESVGVSDPLGTPNSVVGREPRLRLSPKFSRVTSLAAASSEWLIR